MDAVTSFGNNFLFGALCVVLAFLFGWYGGSKGKWPWSR